MRFRGASHSRQASPGHAFGPDSDWQREFETRFPFTETADQSDAIELVNSSRFGNATSIFTGSGKAAREYSSRVEAGMVGVNIGVAAPMAFFPFAGWKNSFFGDLHAHGKDAVMFYTEQKVLMTRWF